MKECFGIELATRFFIGDFGVDAEDLEARQKHREECYACPDFEHCYMVLDLVCKLRTAEGARRSASRPRSGLT